MCRSVLTVLIVLVLFCASASAGQSDSATGAGYLDHAQRVFAFTATRQKNGNVVGQGVEIYLNKVIWHFAVNCLNVVDNVATLGGVLTNYKEIGSDYDLTGSHFWLRVIDNGEGGHKASKDRMTFLWYNDPSNCTEDCVPDCTGELPQAEIVTIDSGNIQVRQQTQ